MIRIFSDASLDDRTGWAGWGAWVEIPGRPPAFHSGRQRCPRFDSTRAEWLAAAMALTEGLVMAPDCPVWLLGDSDAVLGRLIAHLPTSVQFGGPPLPSMQKPIQPHYDRLLRRIGKALNGRLLFVTRVGRGVPEMAYCDALARQQIGLKARAA